jgi:hypothetical protein
MIKEVTFVFCSGANLCEICTANLCGDGLGRSVDRDASYFSSVSPTTEAFISIT